MTVTCHCAVVAIDKLVKVRLKALSDAIVALLALDIVPDEVRFRAGFVSRHDFV